MGPAGPARIGLGDTIEEMIENHSAVIGTPDDAVAQLERYWEKTGGFGCMLILAHNWASVDATKKSFELFARHVMPAFAGRNDRRTATSTWLGDNREAFSGASRAATQQALEKHAAEEAQRRDPVINDRALVVEFYGMVMFALEEERDIPVSDFTFQRLPDHLFRLRSDILQ